MEEFHDALHSLSVDQLHALETIQQHIRPQILQHPSAIPLHLFITGGAGNGKSYLTKLIYEYINRGSNNPTSTVLLLAPTGLAASNIHGCTIQCTVYTSR
jgi:pantothenate kinase-related protein Tda10